MGTSGRKAAKGKGEARAIHHSYPEPASPREREEHGGDERGVHKSNFNAIDEAPLNTRRWKARVEDTLHHAGAPTTGASV